MIGGPVRAGGTSRTDGAAFRPVSGTWRALADAPAERRYGLSMIWTGAQALLVLSAQGPGGEGAGAAGIQILAYTPAADDVRRVAPGTPGPSAG